MSGSYHHFANLIREKAGELLGVPATSLVATDPPKPELGDIAIGCFPAAKVKKVSPASIANDLANAISSDDLIVECQAAGPFVNFRINRAQVFNFLGDQVLSDWKLLPSSHGQSASICIDFSSPNISKQLAYHHIRSTVLGNVMANLFEAVGYSVARINHLGDWGTTHGMLIAAYKMWGVEELSIQSLNELYVRFRSAMKEDPALEETGREWFKKLEDGDEEATQLWTQFREISWKEFQRAYDLLGINFTEVRGESAYQDDISGVISMLEEKGLTAVSEGALVVPLGEKLPPLLLRKQDGATLYGTRDVATALYRWNTYQFERNLYVVDRGQSVHFRQVFLTLEKAGYDWVKGCEHIPFGLVRLGGKKTSSRSAGGKQQAIRLMDVLEEAQKRSQKRIQENNPEMTPETLAETAKQVGVGAVVFSNLASQRDKDVDFDWEQVLSVDGDSGPYLQYSHARCCALLEKATASTDSPDWTLLTSDHEWAIALKLLQMPDIVVRAAEKCEPHIVSRYLLDLAALFSRWYTSGNQDASLRILTSDDALQTARLALVRVVQTTLNRGLQLLGMEAPSRM